MKKHLLSLGLGSAVVAASMIGSISPTFASTSLSTIYVGQTVTLDLKAYPSGTQPSTVTFTVRDNGRGAQSSSAVATFVSKSGDTAQYQITNFGNAIIDKYPAGSNIHFSAQSYNTGTPEPVFKWGGTLDAGNLPEVPVASALPALALIGAAFVIALRRRKNYR